MGSEIQQNVAETQSENISDNLSQYKDKISEKLQIEEYSPGDWDKINKVFLEITNLNESQIPTLQSELGVEADGKIGPKTLKALFSKLLNKIIRISYVPNPTSRDLGVLAVETADTVSVDLDNNEGIAPATQVVSSNEEKGAEQNLSEVGPDVSSGGNDSVEPEAEESSADSELVLDSQENVVEDQIVPILEASVTTEEMTELNSSEKIIEENARPGFTAEIQKYPGRAWLGKLPGNGNRDVGILIPPNFDPNKKTEIVYHFHGTTGDLINENIPSSYRDSEIYAREVGRPSVASNRYDQVANASLSRDNVIIVYPISAGQRGDRKIQNSDSFWMDSSKTSDNFSQMHAQVLSVLQNKMHTQVRDYSITAKGHSAGGRALMNIANSGAKIDRYDFLDASYGNWVSTCYNSAIINNPNLEFNVFLIPSTQTDNASVKRLPRVRNITINSIRGVKHGDFNSNFFNWNRAQRERI
jgi:hypothetical protein